MDFLGTKKYYYSAIKYILPKNKVCVLACIIIYRPQNFRYCFYYPKIFNGHIKDFKLKYIIQVKKYV